MEIKLNDGKGGVAEVTTDKKGELAPSRSRSLARSEASSTRRNLVGRLTLISSSRWAASGVVA